MVDQSVNSVISDPGRMRDWIQFLLLLGALTFGAIRWVDRLNVLKGLVKRVENNERTITNLKYVIQGLRQRVLGLEDDISRIEGDIRDDRKQR